MPASRARSTSAKAASASSTHTGTPAFPPHLQKLQPLVRVPELGHRDAGRRGGQRRGFTARQSVVQIYGTCESCRTGRPPAEEGATSELLFARDALAHRHRDRTQRPRVLHARGAGHQGPARPERVPSSRRRRKASSRHSRKALPEAARAGSAARIAADVPVLQGRGQWAVRARRRRAAGGGRERSRGYKIGIRCERGSHRFFKRYGERFEDSEGKQVFLEFAEEERDHLEMLIREYRALLRRQSKAQDQGPRVRFPSRRVTVAYPARSRFQFSVSSSNINLAVGMQPATGASPPHD